MKKINETTIKEGRQSLPVLNASKKLIFALSLIFLLCLMRGANYAQNVYDGNFEQLLSAWTTSGSGWHQGSFAVNNYHSPVQYATFANSTDNGFNGNGTNGSITTNPGLYIPIDANSIIITFYSYIETQETAVCSDILHVSIYNGSYYSNFYLDAYTYKSTGYVQRVLVIPNLSYFQNSTITNLTFEATLDNNGNESLFRIDDVDIQYTVPPFVLSTNMTDNATGISPVPSNVTTTGNDAKNGMYVWVADGYNPILAWDHGSGPHYVSLNAGNRVLDAKVTLVPVTSSTQWFALAVYYDPNISSYMCEFFNWTGSAFTHYSIYNLHNTSFYYGININADINGNYVIVWDDNNGIYESDGYVSSAIPTAPSSYISIHPNNTVGAFWAPDVALYNTGSTTANVFVSYVVDDIPNSGYEVLVDEWNFSSHISTYSHGWIACPIIDLPYADGHYAYPRIACPNSSSCYLYDECWTVVFEYYYAYYNANQIYGTTSYYDFTYATMYTVLNDYTFFGECFNYELEADNNFRPVVAYSDDFQGDDSHEVNSGHGRIMVGWDYTPTYPTPTPFLGTEPIILMCDNEGFFHDCDTNAMVLPFNTNSVSTDEQKFLSLTGRDDGSDNIFYTWYSGVANDIMYKGENYSNLILRKENSTDNSKQMVSEIYPNPAKGDFTINLQTEAEEQITIEIYNLFGERIYLSKDFSSAASFIKTISLNEQPSGIYFIRETGQKTFNNWKLILNN